MPLLQPGAMTAAIPNPATAPESPPCYNLPHR